MIKECVLSAMAGAAVVIAVNQLGGPVEPAVDVEQSIEHALSEANLDNEARTQGLGEYAEHGEDGSTEHSTLSRLDVERGVFAEFLQDHPTAHVQPWDDSNTLRDEVHPGCWLASASNEGMLVCEDGFIEHLTRKDPIPESEAMIP